MFGWGPCGNVIDADRNKVVEQAITNHATQSGHDSFNSRRHRPNGTESRKMAVAFGESSTTKTASGVSASDDQAGVAKVTAGPTGESEKGRPRDRIIPALAATQFMARDQSLATY